jgi:hypothetical protein
MRRPPLATLEYTLCFEFPVIRDFSKPSVTLHKNGRYLLFKPNDLVAGDVLRELDLRMQTKTMREGTYFGLASTVHVKDWHKVELWKHLSGNITKHPYCKLLKSYGVEVGTASTLENYIRKEYPRRMLEATPYTAVAVTNDDVALFERCSVGANLLCTRNFVQPGESKPTFEKGKRYMVVRTGGEGVDKMAICTEEIKHSADIKVAGEGLIYEWSALDPAMESHFDDSENVDFGQDIRQKYPTRVEAMEARVAQLAFVQQAAAKNQKHPLYEHVRLDAAEEALKRGVVNCKLMRMGKTSEAITVAELWGSKTVAVIGTKNVRLAWRREFKRMGYPDSAFVMVNRLADLEKTGRFYLMTYDWIKDMKDPSAAARDNYENYLHPAEREVKQRTSETDATMITVKVALPNLCPHCQEPMVRPEIRRDPTGRHVATNWLTAKGYLCRNPKCTWTTDHRATQESLTRIRAGQVIHGGTSRHGAAWAVHDGKLIHHQPGSYVDYGLAAHAQCSGEHIRGRWCQECGETDGTWVPPRYRHLKDRFTAVIGDEIHNAKDGGTQNARAMYSFRARRRMAMTGTLLSNSPLDAYWPLAWAIGGPRDSFPYFHVPGKKEFENRFCDFVYLEKPTGDVDEETGEEVMKTVRKRTPFLINPPDWWRMMQPKIKRRNYADPLFQSSLMDAGMKQPEVKVFQLKCPMHPKQVALMLDALRDFNKQYAAMKEAAESKNQEINPAMVISKMTALRKIATVPERLNADLGMTVYTGPNGGGKMIHIKNLVDKAIAEGKKTLILTDFKLMQGNCQELLKAYNPIRLITEWGDDKRDEAVSLFADDPDRRIFIAGTRAVRESIDLSVADITICCDLLWSPAFQCQAWSRTMAPTPRERTCTVYTLLSQNSLDEHIFTVFYSKLVGGEQAMDRKVMNRRAMDYDVKFFAERVLEEEAALASQLRDMGDDDVAYMPEFDLGMMEERI